MKKSQRFSNHKCFYQISRGLKLVFKIQTQAEMKEAVSCQRSIVFFLWNEGTPGTETAHRLTTVFAEIVIKKRCKQKAQSVSK